ncbi:chemotaxis protein CheY [Stenotrophomonas ginsengisoli]|uniref:Chemotaxis protein CheY n=1 Tax=Stenotrophomonas ginsengisoli TaxID=336566 RepID=A0A0R0DAS4_9GAMM|nr:response regulator transcription factor [Stenotrophomonas ginsengisoli]KRG74435.1 chemotaxis protein CheY [Stenotrophomonas ginsengisoli]
MRLLVIDDNQHLVANIFDYFEPRGHVLDAAPDGVTGLYLATTQEYDAIILDWMMPRLEGTALLERLRREHGSTVPVIMLTARGELPDKIAGFRSGADDYLVKPFALPELEVRLEALQLRRDGRSAQQRLQVGDLSLDLSTLEAHRAGHLLHLYPACRKLLEVLMRASPAAVPRERLEQALWGDELPDGDMLRSHIYELRRAVDAPFAVKLLHTLPKLGYRLRVPDQEPVAAAPVTDASGR